MNNRLILSADIYSQASIEKACQAYKNYADIKIKQTKLNMELTFDRCMYESGLTMCEFENYLINVENAQRC